LRITSSNVDRVDLLVDDRPVLSQDLSAAATDVPLPRPLAAGSMVVAQGYRQGVLVSNARLSV
jgi:hypothetical protein